MTVPLASFVKFVPTTTLPLRLAMANTPLDANMMQTVFPSPTAASLDLLTITATELHRHLVDGTVTTVDLVYRYMSQIKKYDRSLHAVIETTPLDKLIEQAKGLDAELKAGKARGPLHGIPILIKDNINTAWQLGMHTTSGSYALHDMKPKKHAEVVARVNMHLSLNTRPCCTYNLSTNLFLFSMIACKSRSISARKGQFVGTYHHNILVKILNYPCTG